MKRYFFVLFIIFTVSGLLFSTQSPGETVVVRGNDCFGISIEHYKERNGWTPVVLFSRHLELFCRMNSRGQVFEGLNHDPSNLQPVFTIDLKIGGVHVGEGYFSFLIEEQNPVRTRIRLLDKKEPLTLKISGRQNRVEFYIGGIHLPLHHTRAEFTEIAHGLYELTFDGPWVFTYWEFIYEQATGRIYSPYDPGTPLGFERGRMRPDRVYQGEHP